MAIYMKFGEIEGDVTTKGYEKWIQLDTLTFGVGRSIGSAMGKNKTREADHPTVSEIIVTKLIDKASTKLLVESLAGKLDTKTKIDFTTTADGGIETFLKLELTDCGLSQFSMQSNGAEPQESLSLNFTKITYTHKALDSKVNGTPVRVGYDLAEMHTL
jgi:type VI secretion system secreted protein Hcp